MEDMIVTSHVSFHYTNICIDDVKDAIKAKCCNSLRFVDAPTLELYYVCSYCGSREKLYATDDYVRMAHGGDRDNPLAIKLHPCNTLIVPLGQYNP